MNLIDSFFRRRPPIRDLAALADFVDEQSAFLVQKGIFEYSRARSGHYSKVLFAEKEFQQSVEESRWRAFPIGLAMVGELVAGIFRQQAGRDERSTVDAVSALVLGVFDRYPVPQAIDKDAWLKARAELAARLGRIGLHPPKLAMDIPEPFAKSYFDLMPIHKSLRGSDFPAITAYLRVTLCNVHDELTRRMDSAALADQLNRPPD
jgi:hypothetical protein